MREKNRFYIFMSCHEFLKQYFFFKSFFFSFQGIVGCPFTQIWCILATYIEEKWIQIFTYSTYMWNCQKKIILIFSAKPYTKSNPYHPTTPGGIIAWEKYKIIFHAKILTICFMRIVITILKSNYKYVHRYIMVLTYIHIHLWMFMC